MLIPLFKPYIPHPPPTIIEPSYSYKPTHKSVIPSGHREDQDIGDLNLNSSSVLFLNGLKCGA